MEYLVLVVASMFDNHEHHHDHIYEHLLTPLLVTH